MAKTRTVSNTVSGALIGGAVGYYLSPGKREAIREKLLNIEGGGLKEKGRETTNNLKEKSRETTDNVKERSRNTGDKVKGATAKWKESAGEKVSRIRDSFSSSENTDENADSGESSQKSSKKVSGREKELEKENEELKKRLESMEKKLDKLSSSGSSSSPGRGQSARSRKTTVRKKSS